MVFSYEHKALLSEKDSGAIRHEGTATISGEVSVTKPDGKMLHGEESRLYLIPVTPYTTEWFEHTVRRDHTLTGLDPRSFRVTRVTVVGTGGRFQFTHVPPGDYYLTCTITPDLKPYRFLWAKIPRAGIDTIKVAAVVSVRTDEQVTVTVTQP